MRRLALGIVALTLGVVSLAVLGVAGAEGRARHLALPVLSDPSLPRAPAAPLGEAPPCAVRELGRVPARPTALLRASDGALWVGTFDQGVWRVDRHGGGDAAQEVPGLEGRGRFVNALAEMDGLIWAGTQRGAVAFQGGTRAFTALSGVAVTALVPARGALLAGTSRGVAVLSRQGARWLALEGAPSPLRVTSLAADLDTLWAGTADGLVAAPLDAALGGTAAARSIPLVFGDPPARTNVVVALATLGERALVGTDDGGLVLVGPDGQVSALRLDVVRANEASPGAAAAIPGAAAVGTQGAGLILARDLGGRLAAARPAAFPAANVSALARDGDVLLAGTADGAVLELRCGIRADRASPSTSPTVDRLQ